MDALNGRQYDGRDLRITMDAGRPSRSALFPIGIRIESGSVADPDPGSGAFLIRDPEYVFFPDLGSLIPTHIFESLLTIF
jgi:hypothetical protein